MTACISFTYCLWSHLLTLSLVVCCYVTVKSTEPLQSLLSPSEFWREVAPRILKACLVLLRSPKLQLFGTLLGLSSRLGSMLGDRRRTWMLPKLPGTPGPTPGPTVGTTRHRDIWRWSKMWCTKSEPQLLVLVFDDACKTILKYSRVDPAVSDFHSRLTLEHWVGINTSAPI